MKSLTLISLAAILVVFLFFVGIAKAEWNLVWADEFDHGEPLSYRWNFETGCNGWGNNELQCYTDQRPSNVRQEGGRLIIQANRESWNDGTTTLPFTSTRMTSKTTWAYGKFEFSARLPKGKHLWPAIWMMPSESVYGGWPSSGEIDITEYRGQKPNQILGTLHFGPSKDNKGSVGTGERDFPIDFSQDFHTFALEWSPNEISWLLDGVIYHTESIQKNFWPGFYPSNGSPFDKNFFIILNLAVGGSFFNGEPFDPIESDGWIKNTLEIEYVRKYSWV